MVVHETYYNTGCTNRTVVCGSKTGLKLSDTEPYRRTEGTGKEERRASLRAPGPSVPTVHPHPRPHLHPVPVPDPSLVPVLDVPVTRGVRLDEGAEVQD